jgi:peptide/nickel transport system substrate-binding protein
MDAPSGRYMKDSEVAQAIAGQLGKAGFRVRVHILEWGVMSKKVFSHQTSPLALLAWGNPDMDPESHNKNLLRSNGAFSQFADPALDGILEKASVEMDPDKRKADLFEQQAWQRKEFPIVYVDQIGMIVGVSGKLAGWTLRPDEKVYFYTNNVIH